MLEREPRFENGLDRKLNLTLENSISEKDVEDVRVFRGTCVGPGRERARPRPSASVL